MDTLGQLQILMQNFYRAFWIPASIYQGTECLVSYVPVILPFDAAYQQLIGQSIQNKESLSFTSHSGVIVGSIQVAQSELRVVVGPVAGVPCNSRYLDSLLSYYGFPLSSKPGLQHWLEHTPTIDGPRFMALLRFLNGVINEDDKTPMDTDTGIINSPLLPSTSSRHNPDVSHDSQQVEDQLLTAIEDGKPDLLLRVLLSIKSLNAAFGNIGDTYTQALQNIAITATVLSSRAAIRGGMDYEQALTLSDQYIDYINHIEKEENYYPLIGSIMMNFCERVRDIRQYGHTSALTNAIVSYVLANLYHKPTVASVATHLQYNASYISHVFRADMGIPLKTWIQEQKIKEADRLLNVEHKKISEVAAALGYSSTAHFQTAYKHVTGHTPGGKR